MIYQSTDTCMTSRETRFLCFVQLGARIKASEILEKMFNRSYLQERKIEKRGQKEHSTTLECLNYKKSNCFN